MKHSGILRCLMVAEPPVKGNGLIPDLPDMGAGVTWKVGPHGLPNDTPNSSSPECIIEFSTDGDRLAELEAHAGVLYIFEYGER